MAEIIFPKFVGNTEEGERISLYQIDDWIHIKVDDEDVRALDPAYDLSWYHDDLSSITEVVIKSETWSGTARGGKQLVEAAEPLRRE